MDAQEYLGCHPVPRDVKRDQAQIPVSSDSSQALLSHGQLDRGVNTLEESHFTA